MKPRYFFISAMLLGVLSIIGLRSNSLRTVELKQQITTADSQSQDISQGLTELRNFVFTHMNASAKFELTASYERAVARARQASDAPASGDVYAQAQASCGQDVGTNSVAQVQCVQNYLEQNLQVGANPQAIQLPDRSLYNYVFVSPTWTADLAGIALLTALLCSLVALIIYVRESFRPN